MNERDEEGREILGQVPCDACGEKAHLKKSNKGASLYYNCDECGYQGFARRKEAKAKMQEKANKGKKDASTQEIHTNPGAGAAEDRGESDDSITPFGV